jgi:hypothetical protein
VSEFNDIFGIDVPQKKPDRKMSLALLLRHLATMMEAEAEEEEEPQVDGVSTEPEEVRVRPRIEPLGGG